MELEKKSNLRSLVPAVLVGLLALAANEYTRMDPAVLRQPVEAMERRIAALMKKKEAPKAKKTPLAELKHLQAKTRVKFEKWRSTRDLMSQQKTRSIVDKADALTAAIHEDQEVNPDDKSLAKLLQASIYFIAAEWRPTEYSSQFVELADQVIANDPSNLSDRVAVLRFYHHTEFGDPDNDVLLADLRTFGDSHSQESSIEVYSMVSAELWRRGHRQLSIDVLNQGIRLLTGSVGISRLVNQLIDQQQY